MDKQIYDRYIEEFTDDMKDYVKATKREENMNHKGWQEIIEDIEQFRVEMLSLLGEIK